MDRPGEQQEMVFCHECENEWYRSDHGLVCPSCHSEFTEIIENDNDPREPQLDSDDELVHGLHAYPNPPEQEHGQQQGQGQTPPPNVELGGLAGLFRHNPFALPPHMQAQNQGHDNQNAEANRQQSTTYTTQNGRYVIHRSGQGYTEYASFSFPSGGGMQQGGPNAMMPNLLSGLTQTFLGGMGAQRPGHASPGSPLGGRGSPHNQDPPSPLRPRDTNNPSPPPNPMDPLQGLLGAMFSNQGPIGHGYDVYEDEPRLGRRAQMPFLPHAVMPAILEELIAFGGRHGGDAVHSQEELDRIISQLMEQTNQSNAPGPAPESAISNLQKGIVDDAILGESGKAECSICMDELSRGDQITFLPCKHWFHHDCVASWLREHDSCPQCRKSIMPEGSGGSPTNRDGNDPTGFNGGNTFNPDRSSPSSPSHRRSSQGRHHSHSSTSSHRSHHSHHSRHSHSSARRPSGHSTTDNGGGLRERMRQIWNR